MSWHTSKPEMWAHTRSRFYLCADVTTGGSTEGTGDAISNTSQTDGDAPMYATNRVGPAFLYDFGPINRYANATWSILTSVSHIYMTTLCNQVAHQTIHHLHKA